MLGRILKNQYRIIQQLGRGGLGTAYLVEDLNPEYKIPPRFVVKHLQPDYSGCKSQREKDGLWKKALELFEREAKVLQKLGRCTTQIPTLEDFFAEDDQFYIVQEWIEGETLSKEMIYGVGWTQQKTIQLLIEILEPLQFCHAEGVIHRDLKPDNLMRRRRNGELVIIDFGAVREVTQHLTPMVTGHLRPITQIGTLGYASGEQLKGSPVPASDIYAVGAIGMQAMTGIYPHEVYFDAAIGIFAWQKVPGCYATSVFANVLNRMLADSADVRYPDASAALAALKPLVSAPVNQTHNPSPPPVSPPASPSIKPTFRGSLSQEIFTFETAKLQQVEEQRIEVVKKPGWLGIGEREERQTKKVKTWKAKNNTSQAERFVEDLGGGATLEMVYIPAGTFTMGAPESEAGSSDNERPQHLVAVSAFYMGRYAVTQAQYLAVMGKNPAHWQGGQLPVEQVSWHDAQEFCQKLSAKTVKKYQLPSEAMWEYACRAGTTTPFHFGEAMTLDVANFNNAAQGQYRGKTTVVGSFPSNDFGLADMHGNVWEWCADHWHENYQGAPLDGSSWGGNDNAYRLLRGGSWGSNSRYCRSAGRNWWSADYLIYNFGFRVIHLQDS
jgi:eukaryotic-like serine/threonine-protein kinase